MPLINEHKPPPLAVVVDFRIHEQKPATRFAHRHAPTQSNQPSIALNPTDGFDFSDMMNHSFIHV